MINGFFFCSVFVGSCVKLLLITLDYSRRLSFYKRKEEWFSMCINEWYKDKPMVLLLKLSFCELKHKIHKKIQCRSVPPNLPTSQISEFKRFKNQIQSLWTR